LIGRRGRLLFCRPHGLVGQCANDDPLWIDIAQARCPVLDPAVSIHRSFLWTAHLSQCGMRYIAPAAVSCGHLAPITAFGGSQEYDLSACRELTMVATHGTELIQDTAVRLAAGTTVPCANLLQVGLEYRTNKNAFPKVDRVRPSHQTLAIPRFGLVSAVIWPAEPAVIEYFSQFLDDSRRRAERYQSRDAQRHSRRVYGVAWFSRTIPPGAAAPGR